MKKAMSILAVIIFVSMVSIPVCFAQPPGGKKGGAPGKGKGGPPKPPTHEEFVAMYDRDNNGEVSMDEFLEGPKGGPAGEKGGKNGPPPGGKK